MALGSWVAVAFSVAATALALLMLPRKPAATPAAEQPPELVDTAAR